MTILQALKDYLAKVLNFRLVIHPWKKEKKIPFFLRELYGFYQGSILEKPCLFLVVRGEDEISPATLNKHIKQLEMEWTGFCVYVRPRISSYNRKRLIEKHIPFIIPDNQMYLPEFCIDLRERFRKTPKIKKVLSSAAQTVCIYVLLHKDKEKFMPSELAKELNYSRMTMTRVFNELESMHIGKMIRKGKERLLYFENDRYPLWEQIKSVMSNPVNKTMLLKQHGKEEIKKLGSISGLTALGMYSMLNQPKLPVYAISKENWKNFANFPSMEEVFSPDEADIELQIWEYNPKLFAKEGLIDPFSLFLNLRESKDERIEAALENLMEKMK